MASCVLLRCGGELARTCTCLGLFFIAFDGMSTSESSLLEPSDETDSEEAERECERVGERERERDARTSFRAMSILWPRWCW